MADVQSEMKTVISQKDKISLEATCALVDDIISNEQEATSILCSRCQGIDFESFCNLEEEVEVSLGHLTPVVSTSCTVCLMFAEMARPAIELLSGIDDEKAPWQFRLTRWPAKRSWPPGKSENKLRVMIEVFGLEYNSLDTYLRVAKSAPKGVDSPNQSQSPWKASLHRLAFAVQECNDVHYKCRNSHSTFPIGARVISCTTRQLVPLVEGIPYCALSYVWGTKRSPLSPDKDAKICSFQSDQDEVQRKFPRTIEDALVATKELGFQYLWVDKYCIDQDDLNDKLNQISQMASIYSFSTCTLCALSPHEDFGLYGISRHRSPGHINIGPNSVLYKDIGWSGFQQQIEKSDWTTRGWTYQEPLLSRHCIFFTIEGAFSVCHEYFRDEYSDAYGRKSISNAVIGTPEHALQETLIDHISHYQGRKLTYESDAFHAFRGVLSSMIKNQSYFGIVVALPRTYGIKGVNVISGFAFGLLWQIPKTSREAREYKRRKGFPSWSWVSTNAAINMQGILSSRDKQGIEFLRKGPDDDLELDIDIECLDGSMKNFAEHMMEYSSVRVVPELSNILHVSSYTVSFASSTQSTNGLSNAGLDDHSRVYIDATAREYDFTNREELYAFINRLYPKTNPRAILLRVRTLSMAWLLVRQVDENTYCREGMIELTAQDEQPIRDRWMSIRDSLERATIRLC